MIKFKIPEYKNQFWGQEGIRTGASIFYIHHKLGMLLYWLAHYFKSVYNLDITVTDLLRNQSEQDRIYLNSSDAKKYKKEPWKSVHQFGRGVDISLAGLNERIDIPRLITHINTIWDYGDGEHKCALVHDVGAGMHLHLQVKDETIYKG